jgi:hypothetical protein
VVEEPKGRGGKGRPQSRGLPRFLASACSGFLDAFQTPDQIESQLDAEHITDLLPTIVSSMTPVTEKVHGKERSAMPTPDPVKWADAAESGEAEGLFDQGYGPIEVFLTTYCEACGLMFKELDFLNNWLVVKTESLKKLGLVQEDRCPEAIQQRVRRKERAEAKARKEAEAKARKEAEANDKKVAGELLHKALTDAGIRRAIADDMVKAMTPEQLIEKAHADDKEAFMAFDGVGEKTAEKAIACIDAAVEEMVARG